MGVGPGRRWSVVILLASVSGVALGAPVAGAEDAALFVEGGLPLQAAGGFDMLVPGGTVLASGHDGKLQWGLHADSLHVRIVETWIERAGGDPSMPPVFTGTRVSESSFTDVTMQVDRRSDGFQGLAWTKDGDVRMKAGDAGGAGPAASDASWRSDPEIRVDRLSSPLVVEDPVPRATVDRPRGLSEEGFSHTLPAGRLMVTAQDPEGAVQGDLSGFVFGADAVVESDEGSRSFTLAKRVEERDGLVYLMGVGWTGPGTHEEEVVRYMEFDASGAELVFIGRDAPMLRVYGGAFEFSLAGHLAVPQAHGRLLLEGDPSREVWHAEQETVVVSGRFDGSMVPVDDPKRVGLTGSGDMEYVAAGAQEARPVRAVAGVAGAMVLVAGLVTALQWLSPSTLALFTRMDTSKVLAHPLRDRIYASIQRRPGVSPQMLARQEEAGWSTIIYHLRVLERHGLVCGVRDGRHRRYFDSTSGRWSNGRKDVLAVLLNPSTARVACLVRHEPGIAQRRVADRLGLAPSSVNWHVRRLAEAGLVSRARREGRVRLHPGEAWGSLTEAGALPLVHAVAAGEEEPALQDEDDKPAASLNNGDGDVHGSAL